MFKFIRRCIITFIFIICLIVGGFVWMGYNDYESVLEEKALDVKIQEIQTSATYVTYENISKDYFDALIAIEDKRFETHSGIDIIALLRTTLANIVAKDVLGGGSTITQQLAKNLYFMNSNKITRKVSEAFMANALEQNYSKQEIIELYANVVYFGDNYYGIYAASKGYFHVHPSNLSLGQASMLAGLPQAPSIYALSNNNPASYTRQEEVLKAMLEQKLISTDELMEALREKW